MLGEGAATAEARAANDKLRKLDTVFRDLVAAWCAALSLLCCMCAHIVTFARFNPNDLELVRLTWNSPASLLEQIARLSSVRVCTCHYRLTFHFTGSSDSHYSRLQAAVRKSLCARSLTVSAVLQAWSWSSDVRVHASKHLATAGVHSSRTHAHNIRPAVRVPLSPVTVPFALRADNIREIISEPVPADAETNPAVAVFYSINSTHDGFQGIDLGNMLIKRVAALLKQEFPSLVTFTTVCLCYFASLLCNTPGCSYRQFHRSAPGQNPL